MLLERCSLTAASPGQDSSHVPASGGDLSSSQGPEERLLLWKAEVKIQPGDHIVNSPFILLLKADSQTRTDLLPRVSLTALLAQTQQD